MDGLRKNRTSGFALWKVVLLVSLFGVTAAIIIPNFRCHCSDASTTCINNLRQIDAAAQEFALENHLTNGASINFPNDLTPYIKLNQSGKIPPCPSGGIYIINKIGDKPTCSLGTSVTPEHVEP